MKRYFMIFSLAVCTPAMIYAGGKKNVKQVQSAKKYNMANNPFLNASPLPFHAPQFDKIHNEDYEPAFVEGMRLQTIEIQNIANNKSIPTFENTLVAMEKSGQLLHRVNSVFNSIVGANSNPTLQKIEEEIAPKMAAHQDAIYLNDKLFQRVKAIYDNRAKAHLQGEDLRLTEYYYQQFVLAGANLSTNEKTKMKAFNAEEATLSAKFSNKLIAAAKAGAYSVADVSKLAGLSESELKAAAKDAGKEGKWMLPLQNTTQQPALQSLTNRNTRHELFENSWNRAEHNDTNDTRALILRIAAIRAEKAKLLGYKSYADWKLQDQMAKSPENVEKFFSQLIPAAVAKSNKEAADIQQVINKESDTFKVKPWDWDFYAEKVRKERYDLDENQIKPYFELNSVLMNGVFYAANQLYGLTFKERKDLPVYQEDVRVFEVIDADGKSIGLFYCDYFKRDNKSGGAWMNNLVDQSTLLGTQPVIYNVCNFTKPAAGQPALISFDDVTTMFHEFGHALHGFFASQKYLSISGTNVARDFVEFPSQFNEHWATYPSILKNYAKHYQTGAVIPQELLDKIKKSATFNQGYALTEIIAAADLDMKWHSLNTAQVPTDADRFEVDALQKAGFNIDLVPPRYRSSYFLHIWGNGYAAGYYAYLWTEMLDDDAYEWFNENGGLTRPNGDRFRKMILSKGNTENYAEMYRAFRGKDASIQPLLKNRGLVE